MDDKLTMGDVVLAYKNGEWKIYFVEMDEIVEYLQNTEKDGFYIVSNFFHDALRVYASTNTDTVMAA